MLSVLTLELAEPFKIVVENRLNTISPYVFLEQETWFEPEVPLLREFLQPGMRVIDIGTNCGFYTLLAAHKVGDKGHVWGFEPGLKPARMLKESLRINGYTNVTLYEAAAGAEPGKTWFLDKAVTELSSVVDEGTPLAREVTVESLDHLYQIGKITAADFIKIDAEGFEEQVILGGKTFFAETSPLIMLEVTADEMPVVNMAAAEHLMALGYEYYRHYSGTGCLVPLVRDKTGDFLLNIFLCKPDRVDSLRAAGLLVTSQDQTNRYEAADPAIFQNYFLQLPIVKSCPELETIVRADIVEEDHSGYLEMGAEFLLSQDQTLSVIERVVRLGRAEEWIDKNFKGDLPFAKILSFIKVWAACNRISLIAGLLRVVEQGDSGIVFKIDYPFLPVSSRWEVLDAVNGQFFPWLASMVSEALENFKAFSSLYESKGTCAAYDLARRYGYLTEELERRAALSTMIRGYDQFPEPVFIAGPVQRNRAIWNEITQRLARGERGPISLDVGTDLV